MHLSPDAIKDFQAVYRQEFGVALSEADAAALARELLLLFQTIARALPADHAHICPKHHRQSSP
jgi:hypothetical protein